LHEEREREPRGQPVVWGEGERERGREGEREPPVRPTVRLLITLIIISLFISAIRGGAGRRLGGGQSRQETIVSTKSTRVFYIHLKTIGYSKNAHPI